MKGKFKQAKTHVHIQRIFASAKACSHTKTASFVQVLCRAELRGDKVPNVHSPSNGLLKFNFSMSIISLCACMC